MPTTNDNTNNPPADLPLTEQQTESAVEYIATAMQGDANALAVVAALVTSNAKRGQKSGTVDALDEADRIARLLFCSSGAADEQSHAFTRRALGLLSS